MVWCHRPLAIEAPANDSVVWPFPPSVQTLWPVLLSAMHPIAHKSAPGKGNGDQKGEDLSPVCIRIQFPKPSQRIGMRGGKEGNKRHGKKEDLPSFITFSRSLVFRADTWRWSFFSVSHLWNAATCIRVPTNIRNFKQDSDQRGWDGGKTLKTFRLCLVDLLLIARPFSSMLPAHVHRGSLLQRPSSQSEHDEDGAHTSPAKELLAGALASTRLWQRIRLVSGRNKRYSLQKKHVAGESTMYPWYLQLSNSIDQSSILFLRMGDVLSKLQEHKPVGESNCFFRNG